MHKFLKPEQNFLKSKKEIWKLKKSIAFGPKILRSKEEHFSSIMNFVSKMDILNFLAGVNRRTKANDPQKNLI